MFCMDISKGLEFNVPTIRMWKSWNESSFILVFSGITQRRSLKSAWGLLGPFVDGLHEEKIIRSSKSMRFMVRLYRINRYVLVFKSRFRIGLQGVCRGRSVGVV